MTQGVIERLPGHLRRYVCEQAYERYTAQAHPRDRLARAELRALSRGRWTDALRQELEAIARADAKAATLIRMELDYSA